MISSHSSDYEGCPLIKAQNSNSFSSGCYNSALIYCVRKALGLIQTEKTFWCCEGHQMIFSDSVFCPKHWVCCGYPCQKEPQWLMIDCFSSSLLVLKMKVDLNNKIIEYEIMSTHFI